MEIPVVTNVLKLNDELAALNRESLRQANVFTVDLMGSPGSGKTQLLEATLSRLEGNLRVAVCVGDLTTTRDADRLSSHCDHVVQINTGKGCHLDANQVRQSLTRLPLDELDLLIIENVGNLICPVGFDLGQDAKVGMFSVADGDDKAAKHPYLVVESDLLLLNKMDLLDYVPFQLERFRYEVDRLHPGLELLELSALNPDSSGLDRWLQWLTDHATARRLTRTPPSGGQKEGSVSP